MNYTNYIKPSREILAVIGVYIIATIVMMAPIVPYHDMGGRLNPVDGHINAYLMAWGQHCLLTNPLAFYDAPLFYPSEKVSGLADPFPSWCLTALPLYLITPNLIWNYNLSQLLQRFLAALSAFALTYYLLKRKSDLPPSILIPLSLWPGFIYAFNSRVMWHAAGHPNIIANLFLPLGILYFFRYLDQQKPRSLTLFGLFSLFQLLASWYLAVMYLSAIIFFITYAFVYEFKEKRSLLIYVTVTLFLVTVASLPFAFIHKDKADENGSWRTLAQCVLGSADITGCVLPPTEENRNMTIAGSLLKQFHDTPNRGENNQFLGWTVLLLFVSILYFSTKERKGFFFNQPYRGCYWHSLLLSPRLVHFYGLSENYLI